MTLTPILLINIVLLALGIALHMIKPAAKPRSQPLTDGDPGIARSD